MTSPLDHSPEQLKTIRDKFCNTATLKLHKPLMVFSTSILVVGRCEEVRLQRVVDASLVAELQVERTIWDCAQCFGIFVSLSFRVLGRRACAIGQMLGPFHAASKILPERRCWSRIVFLHRVSLQESRTRSFPTAFAVLRSWSSRARTRGRLCSQATFRLIGRLAWLPHRPRITTQGGASLQASLSGSDPAMGPTLACTTLIPSKISGTRCPRFCVSRKINAFCRAGDAFEAPSTCTVGSSSSEGCPRARFLGPSCRLPAFV